MTTLASGPDLALRFFPGTGASYDRVVRCTTFGLDRLWKRRLLARIPPSRRILDLACGTGILTFELLRRNPGAEVVGVDLTEDYLAVARAKLRRRGGRATFLQGNAESAPVRGPFDAIVSSYVPKYVDPIRMLRHLTPLLRPGGALVLHDFTHPKDVFARALWRLYFAALDPVARRAFPEWRRVFDASLQRLIVETHWVRDVLRALHGLHYERIRVERLTAGAATVVSARRPAACAT